MVNTLKKLRQILTKREMFQLGLLLCIIVMMAFFQAIGVASVMPFIGLVMEPEMVFENRWLNWVYEKLGFTSTQAFIIFAGVAMFVIIFISNAFSAFATWTKIKFARMNNHRLSRRLLGKYLFMPYTYFLNQNSYDLGKNILQEVSELTNSFLLPLLNIITKVLMVVFIMLILFWVDLIISLVAFLFIGGAYITIYLRLSRNLKKRGFKRLKENKLRYVTVYEAFGGIKEIKVLNREPYFLERYSKASLKYAHHVSWNTVVGQLPRFALEVFAFGGIIILVLFMLLTRGDARQIIPIVSLFAFAGYRLMPSLQDIFSSFTKMQFNQAVLDRIYQDITSGEKGAFGFMVPQKDIPELLPFHQEIKLENISYYYPNTCWPAVKEINLTIQNGEKVAFVGPTGSGKTTLVDIILGLLSPQQGKLLVDGVS